MTDNRELDELDRWADWLDARFQVPGTSIRFGVDGLFGLFPGVGDTLSIVFSLWLVARLRRLGIPFHAKVVMIWNLIVDYVIGLIPLIGDIFDIGYKANLRNVRLAQRIVGRRAEDVDD